MGRFLGTSILPFPLPVSAATGQMHMCKPHSGALGQESRLPSLPGVMGVPALISHGTPALSPGAELGLAAGYGFPGPYGLRQLLEAANFPGLVWEVAVDLLGPATWSRRWAGRKLTLEAGQ